MVSIRTYREQDAAPLEYCIVELQSYEKTLEPNRADGNSIAVAYRQQLLTQCHQSRGQIFIAEKAGRVAGFICVLSHVDSGELIEANTDHAYITDLVVLPAYQRQGIGRALLQEAESYARQQGAATLEVDVLAKNVVGRALYTAMSYQTHEIRLLKELK